MIPGVSSVCAVGGAAPSTVAPNGRRLSPFRRRAACRSGVLAAFAMSTGLAAGADFTWSERCGIDWEAWCRGALCSETQYWHYNNWGGEACGVIPPPPGPQDTAHVPLGQVRVFNEDFRIGSLDVGADGAILIDAGYNRRRYLYLEGPSHVNDGAMTLSNPDSTGFSYLFASNPTTISGRGSVILDRYHGYELAVLDSNQGMTLTNGVAHTVRGRGHVRAALANEGLVSADVSGSVLHLLGQNKSNANTIEARNGGLLYLEAFTLTQSPDGLVLADGATVSLRGGVTIAGGHVGTLNGGLLQVWFSGDGGNTFRDVTVDADGQILIRSSGPASHSRLYLAGASLINHGEIRIADNDETGRCYVEALENVRVSGTGAIVLDRDHIYEVAGLVSAEGATLTNAAGHTIRGHGHVRAALANQGLVSADVSGSALHLLERDKASAGTVEARDGGLLYLESFTLTQSPDGRLLADGGTVSLRGNVTVSGGHIETNGEGTVLVWSAVDGGNTLRDVHVGADAQVSVRSAGPSAHSRLFLAGSGMVNDGAIRISSDNDTGRCTLLVTQPMSVSGAGEIVLDKHHGNELGNLDTAEGVTLTHGDGHTIRGRGHVHASIYNEGTLAVDTAGYTITVDPRAPGITNVGSVRVAADAHLHLRDATLFHQTAGSCAVDGTLTASLAPLDLQGGGLRGGGSVVADVNNTGASVEPGSPVGVLTIDGDYAQGGGGRCRIEIAGKEPGVEYDTLAVTGDVTLAGTLEVVVLRGYRPKLGHTFSAMEFRSRTSTFGAIDGQDLGGGKFVTVFHKDTSVELVVSECIDMANFKPKGKRGKIAFKMDTPLANGQNVTVTATDTASGDRYSKTRKAKAGRVRGSIGSLPAGNYDVCVTRTPACGEGCYEKTNVDVS